MFNRLTQLKPKVDKHLKVLDRNNLGQNKWCSPKIDDSELGAVSLIKESPLVVT